MYRKFLFVAGLVLASTAQAQTPDRTIMRHIALDYRIAGTPTGTTTARSSFRAEVRGDVTAIAWGEAEFGAVQNPDRSAGPFVVSLGVHSQQGAILFTQRNGTPLGVGRYRISERADGADEILALVLTGSSTRPTGAFRGHSGWMVVTAASDQSVTGQFQIDAIGIRAAEPEREDRPVSVTGSFSATAASSASRVGQAAE